MAYTAADLQKLSNKELNALFSESRPVAVPRGRFQGAFIRRLDNAGSRLWLPRALEFLGFEIAPFGIDFRSERWYFVSKQLQAGHFKAGVQHSRWRDTRVVALDYSVSKLPPGMRNFLYDEVKPLSDTLLLGLGGINRGVGIGDHFFFSLQLASELCDSEDVVDGEPVGLG